MPILVVDNQAVGYKIIDIFKKKMEGGQANNNWAQEKQNLNLFVVKNGYQLLREKTQKQDTSSKSLSWHAESLSLDQLVNPSLSHVITLLSLSEY